MIAAGIDLGGTKIETQIFDASWQVVGRQRVSTPKDYEALVNALGDQVRFVKANASKDIPIGIGAAGLLNPDTGLAVTANICADGRPLLADVENNTGRKLHYLNDCRALVLSETRFGAGIGKRSVAGLILGTGVGGGLAIDGHLVPSGRQVSGEFGHTSAPAHLVVEHSLPVVKCGCGRMGCIETLIAGPGLVRLAKSLTGQDLTTHQINETRDSNSAAKAAWDVWILLVADLIMTLNRTSDPDVVVIGGGLSQMDGLTDALTRTLKAEQFVGFDVPEIRIAQGGSSSGARGAAYAAIQGDVA